MKKSLLIISAAFLFSCNNKEDKDQGVSTEVINVPSTASGQANGQGADIKFDEENHNFGKITQGEKVSYSFEFTNTGNTDLIITGAQGSCGCTVPSFPKEPIKPGDKGKIDVVFNSEGKSGIVSKTVTVVTNAIPNTRVLTITTEVIVPEKQ